MRYPSHLIKRVTNNMQGLNLEGFIAGQGNPHACVMIIGEAPGRTEIESHTPFSGKAGKELTTSLQQIGVPRETVYITSAVRSRPFAIKQDKRNATVKYPNRKPSQKEITVHAPLLDWEITQIRPQLILTLGNTALQRLVGKNFTISKYHGAVLHQKILQLDQETNEYQRSVNEYRVVPLYHPAAVFYNRRLASVIQTDWDVVKRAITVHCM